MITPDDWARRLADVAADRARQPLRICQLCVDTLGMSGGGISLVTESGNRGAVCSTDERAAQIEELQFGLGEGPCVDAVAHGVPVLVPDLMHPAGIGVDRWPAFMRGAEDAGIRAVFAFPLQIGAIKVGALDLYRREPGEPSAPELSAALMAADAAAIALLALDTEADAMFADGSGVNASYHLEVHQATGMIKEQAQVSIQQALLLLRARAFSSGRPIAEVAADVVERRVNFAMEDG